VDEIAGEMWNHAPEMWEKMDSQGYPTPELTPRDFVDLMAFLFASGYLEEEGDPERGEAILAEKKCRDCHATGEGEHKVGSDLIRWSSSVNPILWAQLFWNHAPAMEEAMREQGVSWPEMTPNEVVDLVAFIRTVGTGPRASASLPGNPSSGRHLFGQHCQRCHQAEGDGGDIGPALGVSSGPNTLTGLAAALWNHTPAMGEQMSALGIERPLFSVQEMGDIITYLFAIRYFETPGDAAVGREVFARSCSECHGAADEGGKGPSLHANGTSATIIASELWNHGPSMYDELKSRGLEWPRLEGQEMHDLIEYLRSLP
jgi:mono/diheme cytochrome c family protein